MMTITPERFRVDMDQADLDDLAERLRRTRWATDFANADWSYGVPVGYLTELVEHWLQRYDWRAHEAEMNRFEHWKVSIDGIPIHYLLRRGTGDDPLPLVLTHGWPWTFWDYRKVIEPLADPGSHGGDPADAFDVVVPSLPGYVFSSPLTTAGVGYPRVAELWHRLMTEVLGYRSYAAGGGDWGAFVTAQLAHLNPPELRGVHLSFPALLGFDYASLGPDDFSDDQAGWLQQNMYGGQAGYSHMAVHVDDPQTLSYALTDSPVGLAAWMLKRRRAWSDCGGDVERRFSKDDLITSFALYWLTGTVSSALRMYPESFRVPWAPRHDRTPTLQAPTAIAVFPRELALVPRHVAERHANLVRYTVMPRGGHFAPAEEPELLVDDLRAMFRDGR
jgi:pimeloyl-ACP methyl ester carboxylesterase